MTIGPDYIEAFSKAKNTEQLIGLIVFFITTKDAAKLIFISLCARVADVKDNYVISCIQLGYFWHVSDFHYDDTYGKEGQSCGFPVLEPGPFGDAACDAPLRLIEDSIKTMAAIKPDVDFILWTG